MKPLFGLLPLLSVLTALACPAAGNPPDGTSLPISRVDQMPNEPVPFHMRDWKKVAEDYVDLAFDFDRTGDYQPLIRWSDASQETFVLKSYVDGSGPEAINCIAAVVSGTLIGRDMTTYRGPNWVKMCQAYISREHGIYVNGVHGRVSGSF